MITRNDIGYIYIVRNESNDKYYIGLTGQPKVRRIQHFNGIAAGRHHSKLWQSDYENYAKIHGRVKSLENFKFYILDKIKFIDSKELREKLPKIEYDYIKEYNPQYNKEYKPDKNTLKVNFNELEIIDSVL